MLEGASDPPAWSVRYKRSPARRRLIGALAALVAWSGRRSFYAPCHIIGPIIGASAMAVSRGLRQLEQDGAIRLIQRGSWRAARASRYEWQVDAETTA